MTPTYTAADIKKLCMTLPVEYDTFKIMVDIIDEEISLYSQEDLIILTQASMIMFCRCMLAGALNLFMYKN